MNLKNYYWLGLALILGVISCSDSEQDPGLNQFPVIQIESQTVRENSGNSPIEVGLSFAYDQPISVDYVLENTEGGNAIAGVDFEVSSGTITFQAGEVAKTLTVELIDDMFAEADEKFQITLSNPVIGRLLNSRTIITIKDESTDLTVDDSGYEAPEVYEGFTRVWEEDFSGDEIDMDIWGYDIGGDGWGNQELQHYTDRPTNSFQDQGYLFIEAKEEKFDGNDYTSARLLSKDKFDNKYGRIDIRARLPKGKGIWPAIWMLGANFDEVGWPSCGEIDIMEIIGSSPDQLHGTCHFPGVSGSNDSRGGSTSLSGSDFSGEFHVFSVEWREDYIEWKLDGIKFFSVVPEDIEGGTWPFNNDFFFIMNVAVGGLWPGSPDVSTVFPQQMLVDYVRLYKVE